MKKAIKTILFISLLIIILITLLIGCFHTVKHTNIKRYNEPPFMSEIKECSEIYILDRWLKSGIELEFITQELIGEDTLVYYFKVVEPEYFYVYGVREYYVKTVYKFKDTAISPYKSWQFDVVWTSKYGEIQAVLGKENNNKELENLIIDELIEIYNSEVYTYTIEELPNAQEDIKYCCIIKFYDGQYYTERIMYIEKSDNVYTEIIIEDKVFE